MLRLIGLILGFGMVVCEAGEWSRVEKEFQRDSVHSDIYPNEKIKVVEVDDYQQLGRLVALRFFEWVRGNPNGVISLPTGRTPQAFIESVKYFKSHWNDKEVQDQLSLYGLTGPIPDTSGLRFVQMDEFYPIAPDHANSFENYIRTYYLPLLGIKEDHTLLMDLSKRGVVAEYGVENLFPGRTVDLSLLSRQPMSENETLQKRALEEANAFARNYDKTIREWGGIGFFLGGMGTDGHIAFINPNAPRQTHLTELSYVQAAQSATALGGISQSQGAALTIGMDSLLSGEDPKIIIMVAGEGKAKAVSRAVEGKNDETFVASKLQSIPHARFYITGSAAKELSDRKLEDVKTLPVTEEMIDEVIINIALSRKKELKSLTTGDIKRDRLGNALVRRLGATPVSLKDGTIKRLKAKIERGIALPEGKRILHTGPHHDDVMLSYYGLLPKVLGYNGNIFVYMTSGFNAVTDGYITQLLQTIKSTDYDKYEAEEAPYALILARALRSARAGETEKQNHYESIILMRHMGLVFEEKGVAAAKTRADRLLTQYFAKKQPGAKDAEEIQTLKGAMRESEEDRHMTYHGVPIRDVYHLRSNFYNGDYFNPLPSIEEDAKPFLKLVEAFKPHIITVAVDTEGTGPDTHFKVEQIVGQTLSMTKLNPKIWGYRNVWHRFTLAEADVMVPVSEDELNDLDRCFMQCYTTQKKADYPPLEHNGTFSELSVIIQRDQYKKLRTLLGSAYFDNNPNASLKTAAGFIFLQQFDKDEYLEW